MTKSKELVTLDKAQFPALADGGAVLERIKQNLGGEEITPADLMRIKVPTGGATTWSVPTADGDESCKELEGVIIHTSRRRAFWENTNPTGDPPNCASTDCIWGGGKPGGRCAECPNNEWGSAIKQDGSAGKGKRCKEGRMIFLLREGRHLPDLVVAPPGSLKSMKQYLLALASIDAPYFAVLTKLELTGDKNEDGFEYAYITPTKIGFLEEETAKAVREYATKLQAVFAAAVVEQADTSDV